MSIVKFAIFLNPPSLFSPNTTLSKVLQNEVNNSQHLNIGDITGGHNDMCHRLGNSAWVEPQGLGTSPAPGPRPPLSPCIPGNFSGTLQLLLEPEWAIDSEVMRAKTIIVLVKFN